MKKLLLSVSVLVACTFHSFSQNEDEKKLNIKPLEEMLEAAPDRGNVDCKCDKNILLDGGFENLTISGASNISATSNPWKQNTYTPQWASTNGPCNKGIVSMWGNKTVYESISQNVSFAGGKTYNIKYTARLLNPSINGNLVRLKISAGSSSVVSTANITSTSWATYTISNWTPGAASGVILQPENNYTQNDGAYVSWIQIDNICIEEACKIPDDKCNPKFNAAPFILNSQGNVVINVNPVITAGAQHYWGLNLASGIGDVTPMPLATITGGGSFGLGISSAGIATPIGMGTGITGSSSGYGYQYQGVGVGKCFKITHYIKCCGKWYSQTNTYCTKVCVDVKEGTVSTPETRDVETVEAAKAVEGRG